MRPAIIVAATVAGLVLLRRFAGAGVLEGEPMMYSAGIVRMAQAIAKAEGFYSANRNALPRRNHNPGDLKRSSVPSLGPDASGHLIFASDELGWTALYRQLELIVDGHSDNFTLDMTIQQMANTYAQSSAPWATIVARELGVSLSTTLRAVLL